MATRPQRQRLLKIAGPEKASGQSSRGISLRPGADEAPDPEAIRWAYDVMADAAPALAHRVRWIHVLRDGHKRLAVLGSDDGPLLALKQYSDDRGAWTRRWMESLTELGLAPPARFGVTPARGWSGAHRTLITDVAPGHPWSHWLLAAEVDRDAAAIAAADWLTELQSLTVPLPDRTGYRAGDELRRQSDQLAQKHPDHAVRLLQITDAAHRGLYGDAHSVGPDLVASHGDLHPENLFIAAGGPLATTAIDLDTAGLRRPSYDVGYALAQLLVVSWMRTGTFESGAGTGLTFWRRWTSRGGADADAVPAEVTRALVQSLHFELITYRTGRTGLVDRWLDVAEAVLDSGVAATFHSLTTAQEVTS